MRKFKQHLAAIMTVAMMLSAVPAQTYAAENRWYKTENGWMYGNKESGEYAAGKVKTINKKTYFFYEDGIMASNEIVPITYKNSEGKEKQGVAFALPDGSLAKGWVALDGKLDITESEGSIVVNDPKCLTLAKDANKEGTQWYHFNSKMAMTLGDETQSELIKLDGEYRFDEKGRMVRGWWESGNERRKEYFEQDGERATNKWLNIDGDWYYFDSDSNCLGASPSNAEKDNLEFDLDDGHLISDTWAPCPDIMGVTITGNDDADVEETVNVGEPITISVEVALASDSNVTFQNNGLTKNHDFSPNSVIQGDAISNAYKITLEKPKNNTTNKFSMTYNAKVPCTVELTVAIDDKKSGNTITITAVAESTAAKKIAAENIFSSIGDGSDVTLQRDSMAELYKTDDSSDADTANTLKDVWKKNESTVADWEQSYAMANNIDLELKNEVSSEAEQLLGGTDIQVVGALLNADNGGTAGLAITEGEKAVLDKDYDNQVDLDISFLNNGQESDLVLPVIITMPVPEGVSESGLKLFHTDDSGEYEEVKSLSVNGDGTATFVADEFSVYSFVNGGDTDNEDTDNDDADNNSGSSSGGSYGASTHGVTRNHAENTEKADGQWILDEKGWWYRNPDGSYPANTWKQLAYNGITDWYHFNAEGYMDYGWYTDADGNVFYLNPVSDGLKGAMMTSWRLIDNKWFYFNPVSDGTKGAMVKDAVIEGRYIDKNGVWNAAAN